jgi:Na+-translocating ferredoxin:NAD+ oxidoreductase subunit B
LEGKKQMADDVYQNLAKHLDNLPTGFPSTESGVELRILKRLFSPEEAKIAVGMKMKQEPVSAIAGRLDMDEVKIAPLLEDMSKKGLIFRKKRGDKYLYMAAQFVIGIWEYHVNSLDKELIEDFNEYVPYLVKNGWAKQKTQQLRVIPINLSITPEINVMPYEQAEQIIRRQSKIVVAPCICRKEHKMMGKGCGRPEEVCLVFSTGAYYYEENGLGRPITQKEALDLLQKGVDAGLVIQPSNAKKAANICMCCGCCCQILKNIKMLPEPLKVVHTNYYAQVGADNCTACSTCVPRCPMDAITVDDTAHVDTARCIGCGLCVPTCDFDALRLEQKKENETYEPPATFLHTYMRIAMERGKFKI